MFNSGIEILAPCGSFDILKTAVKAGADACYIGGSRFGARAYADNVSNDQLEAAIDYIHIHGKKLYLTVNTLIKENELSDAYDYIKTCYEMGIDAFIVQDLGLFKLIRDNFPDVHIHCSTQMNITSYHAADFMKKLGASRVVTAREMSLEEIKLIKDKVDIEVETFVHGAMCYSYSGQCLMSSLAGGRSGNRGRCAQPCRKCYDGEYILSMKDMCALELIPKLVDAGIDSFKIEGRMKNEYYVASAVDAYRELVNDYLNGSFFDKKAAEYKKRLANIYNRGGFCDGYFFMHNGPSMISKHRPNNQGVLIGHLKDVKDGKILIDLKAQLYKGDVLEINLRNNEIIEITSGQEKNAHSNVWLNAPKTKLILKGQDVYRTRCSHLLDEVSKLENKSMIGLNGRFTARVGKPLKLEVSMAKPHIWGLDEDYYRISISDDVIQKSNNLKLDKNQIIQKINQLKSTDYYFEKLDIDADEDAFVPASLIKKLRRAAICGLEEKICAGYKRDTKSIGSFDTYYHKISYTCGVYDKSLSESGHVLNDDLKVPELKIGVKNVNQLEALLKYPDIYGVYMDKELLKSIKDTSLMNELTDRNIRIYLELPYVIKGSFDYHNYVRDLSFDGLYIRNIDAFSCDIDYNKDIVFGAGLYVYNNIARDFLKNKYSDICFEIPKELNINELKLLGNEDSELCIYEYQQVMITANCIKKSKGCCNKKREIVRIKDDRSNIFYAYSNCDECINIIYNGVPFLCFDKDDIIDNCRTAFYRMNFTVEDDKTISAILNYYYKGVKPDITFTTGHMFRGVE